jgi:two-component system osmolarity sensor histidine kinase EnvZ
MPFQRLDRARGGLGHCGLGLAIAARVAAAHGGGLEAQRSEQGFAVVLQGRSLPAAAV